MAWTNNIDWLDGETISELKLDQLTQNVEYVKDRIVPTGGIILWSGIVANIPSGWVLCDGNNGTPDLRGKFIIGAGGAYAPAAEGGANTHTHDLQNHVHATVSVNLDHTHTISHTHTYSGTTGECNDGADRTKDNKLYSTASRSHRHSFSGTTSGASNGNSGAMSTNQNHEHGNTQGPSVDATSSANNIPVYYALCWIMKS